MAKKKTPVVETPVVEAKEEVLSESVDENDSYDESPEYESNSDSEYGKSEEEFNDGLFEAPVEESKPVEHEVIGSAVVVDEPVRDMPKVRHPILVGCKLPHGLVLEHGGKKVTLQGLNKVQLIGARHMVNYVPEDFWNAWRAANPRFPALLSGAIFEGRNNDEIKGKAKDYSSRLTGFEKMKPEAMGVKKAED